MAEDLTISEEATTESAQPVTEKSNKKIIIIGASAILIICLMSIILIFTSFGQKLMGKEEKNKEHTIEQKQEVNMETVQFTTIPEILINLRTADGRSSFLKAQFIIQSPTEETSKKIEKIIPVLADQFQVYLRELDVDDLKGSIGQQRIRQELINRTNALIEPEKINNVLFKNFLIQ